MQPGQPYAPYPPPPPPKKGMSAGAIVAIVLGSIFGGAVLLMVIVGALVGGADTSPDDKAAPKSAAPAPEKPPAAPAEPKAEPEPEPAKEEPVKEEPVKVAAMKTAFTPSILHDGGTYTSVSVTITNNSDKSISINPLYFAITDTGGGKHTHELAADKNQIDTVELAPGENITGTITGKGDFTPKYVTYTEGLFGDPVRGDVS
ncbi:DUF4352 domain-containing protein [Streptomyces sp. MUM 203J]|nr:DUF4352 domain-containing protein [Streptomyces sp. MUM 203J]